MTDVMTDYDDAAAQLDDHTATCGRCRDGLSCSDGDDIAEREFRTWRALQRSQPAAARHIARRGLGLVASLLTVWRCLP